MADNSPPGDLLDRAGTIFTLAANLARDFQDAHEDRRARAGVHVQWAPFKTAFATLCRELLDLRDVMLRPPSGSVAVAEALKELAIVVRRVEQVANTADGQQWATFLDFFPELNSATARGRETLREAQQATKQADPFAFLDQQPQVKPAIDTTPDLAKPPSPLIANAQKEIPGLLADVDANSDGEQQMNAAALAYQIKKRGHTLAAAKWAIHEAVCTGRLRPSPINLSFPSVGVPNHNNYGPSLTWFGGGGGPIALPKDRPAPYEKFEVTATEALWRWWHESSNTASNSNAQLATETQPEPTKSYFVGSQTQEEVASAKPQPETEPPFLQLLKVFSNNIAEDRFKQAEKIVANDALNTNDKLTQIDQLIRFPTTASAAQLGELLGVSKQSVMKTKWWDENRKGEKSSEIGRRHTKHQERAEGKDYDGDSEDE